ncbi:MAG: L-threonylcarbamoyladenylate synthase, partial [Clostridia bacterium]
EAVKSIFIAKGRPSDNPLIVHIANKEDIYKVARTVSKDAQKIIDDVMPNSITIVLPKKDTVPDIVTAGMDTVGIRMPKSLEARLFITACNTPIAAPSANTSSRPSPTNYSDVYEDMSGKISAILMGEPCQVGIESTVLDLTGDEPLILRPGIITASYLSNVLGKTVKVLTDPTSKVNSPGVRYKHYAPKCPMILNRDGNSDKLTQFYNDCVSQGYNPVLLVQNPRNYIGFNTYSLGETDQDVARNLFSALRSCERQYNYIIASYVSVTELSESILNRLVRSCGGKLL